MGHHLDLAGALICLLARLCDSDCSKQMRGSLDGHNIERSDDSARCCVRGWFYRHMRRFNIILYHSISFPPYSQSPKVFIVSEKGVDHTVSADIVKVEEMSLDHWVYLFRMFRRLDAQRVALSVTLADHSHGTP